MSSPADDMITLLVNASVIGDGTGWAIGVGDMQATPDDFVAAYDTGGANPNPRWGWEQPSIQIAVRAGAHRYDSCYAKALDIKNELLGAAVTAIDGSSYTMFLMLGDINYIGKDENDRPRMTLNFRLGRRPATLGNRDSL